MEELLEHTLQSLRDMVEADTVVGRTITAPDNSWIVPISRISVGIVSGSGQYTQAKAVDNPQTAGAGGAGGSVMPLGFLVMDRRGVRFVSVDKEETENKWLALLGSAIDVIKDKH